MPLNVKDERAHRAARELARLRGKTITEVVTRENYLDFVL